MEGHDLGKTEARHLRSIIGTAPWFLWLNRNDSLHCNSKSRLFLLWCKVIATTNDYCSNLGKSEGPPGKHRCSAQARYTGKL